jgi:hypothetical protein
LVESLYIFGSSQTGRFATNVSTRRGLLDDGIEVVEVRDPPCGKPVLRVVPGIPVGTGSP